MAHIVIIIKIPEPVKCSVAIHCCRLSLDVKFCACNLLFDYHILDGELRPKKT